MRYLSILLLCFIPSWAQEQYTMIDSVLLDTEKDHAPELLVVYTVTNPSDADYGSPRELIIYKPSPDGILQPWIRSRTAILDAEGGGIMGDPFMGISFDNDQLTINHFGGSQIKWSYIDKYRFQDGQMILTEHITKSYDGGCHYQELTYNLKTGTAIYTQNKSLQGNFKNCDQTVKTMQATGYFPRIKPVSIEHRDTFDPYEVMASLERQFHSQ